MGSRLTTGFHRMGLVIAIPCMLAGAALARAEWMKPSGPLKPYGFPTKVMEAYDDGTMRDENLKIHKALVVDQKSAGIENERDAIVIGRVIRTSQNSAGSQE